jgi:hypothetical protein
MWLAGCGFNLFSYVSTPTTPKEKLAQAQVLIDDRDYSEAKDLLEDLIESDDSNRARLLLAAAILGDGGVGMWDIISNAVENATSSAASSGSGSGDILSSISGTVLGSDDATRIKRITALREAIGTLREAPTPEEGKVLGTSCFLAGLLIVPTSADATRLLAETMDSLADVRATMTNGGATCPALNTFEESLENLIVVQGAIQDALSLVSSCPILNSAEAAGDLNAAQQAIDTLVTGADQGCNTGNAAIYPTCVRDILEDPDNMGTSGDEEISSCEFLTNCSGGGCF